LCYKRAFLQKVGGYSIHLWYRSNESMTTLARTVSPIYDPLKNFKEQISEETWIDAFGNEKTAEIFKDLAYKQLIARQANNANMALTGNVSRFIHEQIQTELFKAFIERHKLSHERVLELVTNTFAFVVNRPDYLHNSIQTRIAEWRKKYEVPINSILRIINYIFGTDYQAIDIIKFIAQQVSVIPSLIEDASHTVVDHVVYYWNQWKPFGRTAKNKKNWFDSQYQEDSSFTTVVVQKKEDLIITDEKVILEGPCKYMSPIVHEFNTSQIPDRKVEEYVKYYSMLREERQEFGFYTFGWFENMRIQPSSLVSMLNKAFPRKPVENYASCRQMGNCDVIVANIDPYKVWKTDLGKFEDGTPRCNKGKTIVEHFTHFRVANKQRFENLTLACNEPVMSPEEYISKPDQAFKRKRRAAAIQEYAENFTPLKDLGKIKVMPKKDENNRADLIATDEFGDEIVGPKMRAIFNIDPLAQAHFYEESDLYGILTDLFEEEFIIRGQRVRIIPCSTKNPLALTKIRNKFRAESILGVHYILVSGDDSNIWLAHKGRIMSLSLDVKNCDICVSYHATLEFLVFLKAAGYSDLANKLEAFYSNLEIQLDLRNAARDVKFRYFLKIAWRTLSGELLTTLKNTAVVCMLLWCALDYLFSLKNWATMTPDNVKLNISKFCASLGFTMTGECFVQEDFNQTDFLKGWWKLTTHGDFLYQKLPSALASFGRTKTNWLTKSISSDPIRASRMCMRALQLGNSYISENDPILGPYLDMAEEVGMFTLKDINIVHHRLFSEGTYKNFSNMSEEPVPLLDTEAYWYDVQKRYGVAPDDLEDYLTFLSDVTRNFQPFTARGGFSFLHKLMVRDYGEQKMLKKQPADPRAGMNMKKRQQNNTGDGDP